MASPEYLYRYEASNEESDNGPRIEEYEIIERTPKGFWIHNPLSHISGHSKKWVSSSGVKRFAYPTDAEAMESYIIRKMRYVEVCRRNLALAERQYAEVKRHLFGDYIDFLKVAITS